MFRHTFKVSCIIAGCSPESCYTRSMLALLRPSFAVPRFNDVWALSRGSPGSGASLQPCASAILRRPSQTDIEQVDTNRFLFKISQPSAAKQVCAMSLAAQMRLLTVQPAGQCPFEVRHNKAADTGAQPYRRLSDRRKCVEFGAQMQHSSHSSLFAAPFPEGYAATVHFQFPGREDWKPLGM